MAFEKDLTRYFTPEELEKLSPSLADYVRAIFGLEGISPKTEKELWERLTPEEQNLATEIAKRLTKYANHGTK